MSKEKEYKINFSVLYKQEGIKPDEEFVDALEEKLNSLENSFKNRKTRPTLKVPLLTTSAVIIAAMIFFSLFQSNGLINKSPATETPNPIVIDQEDKAKTPEEIPDNEFQFVDFFNSFPNLEMIYKELVTSYNEVLANYTIGYLSALYNQDEELVMKYTNYSKVDSLLVKYKNVDFSTIELAYTYPSWMEPNLTFTYEKYMFRHGLQSGQKHVTDIIPVFQDEDRILISERHIREQANWKGIDFETKDGKITILSYYQSDNESLEQVNNLLTNAIEDMKSKQSSKSDVEVLYSAFPYYSVVLVNEQNGAILDGVFLNIEKQAFMKLYDRDDSSSNFGSLDYSVISDLENMNVFINEVYGLEWEISDLEGSSFYFDEERQVRLIVETDGKLQYMPLAHTYLNDKVLKNSGLE